MPKTTIEYPEKINFMARKGTMKKVKEIADKEGVTPTIVYRWATQKYIEESSR